MEGEGRRRDVVKRRGKEKEGEGRRMGRGGEEEKENGEVEGKSLWVKKGGEGGRGRKRR